MLKPGCSGCLIGVAMVGLMAGCVVGQRPGQGHVLHLVEPGTGGGYWLYLPEGYDADADAERHLPLVVTYHGMKPFDTAHSQIREWQQEADRYGYVVCAPELLTSDLLSPLPLNTVTESLKRDEERVLAIMDELERSTSIDPNKVLFTSWSYGGYIAHYMANRHPDRVSCIAVKQSNFSERILDPQMVPRYRHLKVGIFYTQNDFRVCREESKVAAQWYSRHGFDVKFAVFQDLGHERRPGVAASLFARTCNATPRTPPVELARMQVLDLPPSETAGVATPQLASVVLPPLPTADSRRRRPGGETVAVTPLLFDNRLPPGSDRRPAALPGSGSATAGTGGPTARRRPALQPTQVRTRPVTPGVTRTRTTPPRARPTPPVEDPANPVRVRLSSTIGISPLLVSYSVAPLPPDLPKGAFFLWTDNGEPISNGINGQKLLATPGTHRLEVLVTTADGREFRAADTVTVLERINKGRTLR